MSTEFPVNLFYNTVKLTVEPEPTYEHVGYSPAGLGYDWQVE